MASVQQTFNVTSSINPRFVQTGGRSAILRVGGSGSGNVTFNVNWDDNPNEFGDALGNVTIVSGNVGTGGNSGNRNFSRAVVAGNDYVASFGNFMPFKSFNGSRIQFKDNDGNDTNGEVRITNVSQNVFNFTLGAAISWQNGNYVGVSGDGAPNTVFWFGSRSGFSANIRIRSGGVDRYIGPGPSASGSYSDPLGQSNACGTSPIVRQRCVATFMVVGGVQYNVNTCETATARNDTNPTNFSTPTRANPGNRLLSELEPNTTYTVTFGTVTCIDAPTQARSPGSGWQICRNGACTQGSLTFTGGEVLSMRFTTPDFNQSTTPGGTVDGLTVGQYTSFQNYTVEIGSGTANDSYTLSTRVRRPVIEEVFNFEMPVTPDSRPFPDIDTVSDTPTPSSIQYQEADAAQIANDIEIDQEIKTSDGNAQVKINSGPWRNMRQI